MTEQTLHDLLARATDELEPPDLATTALATARKRRTHRRGALGAIGSAVAIASVVAAITLLDANQTQGPAPGAPTHSLTGEPSRPPMAPEIDPDKAQPLWNPEQVESLPWDDRLGLPRDLTPIRSADLATSTVVAAADHGDLFCLLLPTGEWVNAGGYPEPALEYAGRSLALSDDGSRIAITGRTALWWRDVPNGEWTRVAYPAEMHDYEVRLDFGDNASLLLGRGNAFWNLDLSTGASRRLPFDIFDDVTALPDGDFVASRFAMSGTVPPVVVRVHDGEVINSTNSDPLDSLQFAVGSDTSLVATRADGTYPDVSPTDHDGLLALNLDGLTTRAFLPVKDERAYYADSGGLTAVGWLDDDTVVAKVQPRAYVGTIWVFTWNVETGDLRRVGSYPSDVTLTFAMDAL